MLAPASVGRADDSAKVTKRVDALLAESWKKAGIEPAAIVDDATFLRRAYLDLTGVIPSVSQVRQFLDDKRPDKRARLIDRLIGVESSGRRSGNGRHATRLANIWRDVMLPQINNNLRLRGRAGIFEQWLRSQFADNRPYDQIVREVLTVEGSTAQSGPGLFYQSLELKPEELAASTSRIFLGVQIQCAQCHNHPFDHWTQKDFWGYAAFFAQLQRPPGRSRFVAQIVDTKQGEVTLPDTKTVVPPKFLDEQTNAATSTATRRKQLAEWMTSKKNPYFARATVNRVWAILFGHGLVDPVDDFGRHNPPSHPQLLDELAADFANSGYNLRRLIRILANTRAYQLSSEVTAEHTSHAPLFSRMAIKSLSAEQIYDCLDVATCKVESPTRSAYRFGYRYDAQKQAFIARFEAPSQSATEFQAGIPQALTMLNGQFIAASTDVNRSDILVALSESPFMSDRDRVETLFLATLSRMPTKAERARNPDQIAAVTAHRPISGTNHRPLNRRPTRRRLNIMARHLSYLLCCGMLLAPTAAESVFAAVRAEKPASSKGAASKRYVVITVDGKVYTGNAVSETKDSLRLRDDGGRVITIRRANIETQREIKSQAARARVAAAKALAEQKLLEAKRKEQIARARALQLQEAARAAQIRAMRGRGVTSGTAGVRKDVDMKDNTERLLLLSPGGPVLVELEITLGGKPYRAMRENLITEMLKQSDTNKDGKVTWEEAFDNPRFAFGRLSSSAASRNPALRASLIKRYDEDKDGQVSRYEVRLMIVQFGFGTAFRLSPQMGSSQRPDVKSLLDTNSDGVITADELKVASARLKSRDANENDLLELFEIGGGFTRNAYGQIVQSRGMRLPSRPHDVYLLGPAADLSAAYSGIVSKYGDEKNKVTAAAFPACPDVFKTLDLNKNGVLDSGESIGLHLIKPHLKLKIALAENEKQPRGIKVMSISRLLSKDSTAEDGNDQLSLAMTGWKLRIRVPETASRRYDYTRTAKSVLTRYDKNKNGYIEKKEMGSNSYYQRQFARWDLNNDGKVFVDEIKAMYDQAQLPQRSQIFVTTTTQGPSLFAALDESGDNRLSAREIKNAGRRLLALDTNKNGKIDADEMPGESIITFMQGGTSIRTTRGLRSSRSRTAVSRRGPRWFTHMDKNADGDITLREFLGTKKKFKEIDTNNDGFIERREAEAASAKTTTSTK
eukprot:g21951.t1